MEANKILNADILDLIFEDRNKEYGAYDLRKTYNKRILKALIITASVALLALLGSLLAKAFTSKNSNVVQHEITLQEIKEDSRFQHLGLVRQSRLSVVPIDETSWDQLMEMGK